MPALALPPASPWGRELLLVTWLGALFPHFSGCPVPRAALGPLVGRADAGGSGESWAGLGDGAGAPLPLKPGSWSLLLPESPAGRGRGCVGSLGSRGRDVAAGWSVLFVPEQRSHFQLVFPRTTKSAQTTAAQILYPTVAQPIKERVATFYWFF